MPAKSSDRLSAALEHLRTWAKAQRVAWVQGSIVADRAPVPAVRFVHEGRDGELASAEAFTRMLAELDVAMLVVSVLTLDEESQLAAVGLYEADADDLTDADETGGRAVLDSLLADAHAARHHIGQPGSVVITAITRNPTITIEWAEMAEWYAVIDAADHAFTEMAEADLGDEFDDDDYDEWVEVEPEPEPPPPVPPRRRIEPRR